MTEINAGLATVSSARFKLRHWLVVISFVALVVVPSLTGWWYLWARASDRYESTVGFSVRTEELGSALEMLGGIAEMSGSSSSDTEILYNFIQSQELVREIDERIDLRGIWAKGDPEKDPIFAYDPPGTIEDLVAYWRRMVNVYDADAGLLELYVQAFTPEDAQLIAQEIYGESTEMINRLSAIARQDATSYAREELDQAEERLSRARRELTQFRNQSQIVDPSASVQSQMGLLSSLQLQLAETLIDLDIIKATASSNDPRLAQLERRVAVIESRIEAERNKLGISSVDNAANDAFADLVGEFERLSAERDFAQESYTAARAAYEAAIAEARRQSRYLAAHVRPTLAEAPTHPQRYTLLALTMLFAFLSWAILVLAGYALRDRS
ncbi:capsule biosynthesis protein [Roseovarius aestuariivivens]|uniref:capsule biosynthesis protein n=1 Tax=Roseovarius aestuariivivens TaxID=1888910 RepID=UPI0010815C9E|nr:capsule biosynthesis protein [Roseovarius aestuariivivens]